DGCVHAMPGKQVRIYYATSSKRLADGVRSLLLRVGVPCRVKTVKKGDYRDNFHVHVTGHEHQTAFLRNVGVHGARGERVEAALQMLESITGNPNADTVP